MKLISTRYVDALGHHKFDMMALNSIREGTFITWGGGVDFFFGPAWGGSYFFSG